MAGPTSRLPSGLLDTFGISAGAYPRDLIESIQPIFELVELQAVNNCTQNLAGTPLAVSAIGSQTGPAFMQAAQGETLLVAGATVQCTTLVGEQIEFRATLQGPDNFNTVLKGAELVGRSVAGVGNFSSILAGPFWMSSGMRVGIQVQSITTAGTISAIFTALILRLRR